MSLQPRVSFIMSVFNGERFIREAVESVLNQTFSNFELVVVDDDSTDGTVGVLSGYRDSRIRLIRSAARGGQPAGLNIGLAAAVGEYVARLDADDISEQARLERQVSFLDAYPAAAVGSAWVEIDERGVPGRTQVPPTDCVDIRWRLLFANAFLHSSMLVRRSVLDRVGAYDETIGYGEDYELWSRLAVEFEVANLPDRLVRYRRSSGSKTATITSAQAQVDAIAGGNVERVAGRVDRSGCASSAEFAAAARRLLLSAELEIDPAEATRLAVHVLELQRRFALFYGLPAGVAARHRAGVSGLLGLRLRSIGRSAGNRRATRSGLRLLAGAVARNPSAALRRAARR